MRVGADRERWVRSWMCTSIGPDVFELDDDSESDLNDVWVDIDGRAGVGKMGVDVEAFLVGHAQVVAAGRYRAFVDVDVPPARLFGVDPLDGTSRGGGWSARYLSGCDRARIVLPSQSREFEPLRGALRVAACFHSFPGLMADRADRPRRMHPRVAG